MMTKKKTTKSTESSPTPDSVSALTSEAASPVKTLQSPPKMVVEKSTTGKKNPEIEKVPIRRLFCPYNENDFDWRERLDAAKRILDGQVALPLIVVRSKASDVAKEVAIAGKTPQSPEKDGLVVFRSYLDFFGYRDGTKPGHKEVAPCFVVEDFRTAAKLAEEQGRGDYN